MADYLTSALGLLLPSSSLGHFENYQGGLESFGGESMTDRVDSFPVTHSAPGYNMDQRSAAQHQYYSQTSPHMPGYAQSYAASPGLLSSTPLSSDRRRASSERYETSQAPMRSPYQAHPTTFQAALPSVDYKSVDYTSVSPETPAFTSSSSQSSPFPTHSPLVPGAGSLSYSPGFAGSVKNRATFHLHQKLTICSSGYGSGSYEAGGYGQMPGSQMYLPQPSPYQQPYSTSPADRTLSVAGQGNVRVLNSRPKPQCWEHGCNGRQFSTFSNLLRHQREKSGTAAKSYCPKCGAEFTRTTARNGHILHDKCKRKSMDADAAQGSAGATPSATQ